MIVLRLLFVVVSLASLTACAAQEPFVFAEGEFDRERVGFGQPIADRDDVTICYASNATSPKTVQTLAAKACGAVGKRAVFKGHGERLCPLLTPAAAEFSCVAP